MAKTPLIADKMSDKLIKIAYLYEDLMNTYGDSGDVKILRLTSPESP